MKIAYTFVLSDLFHYGLLQLLEAASNLSDKLICGVLTDEIAKSTGSAPISNYHERSAVVSAIKYVSEVIPQASQDPFENLQQLRQQYPNDEIIFVYGENWGEAPGGTSLNKINITLKRQSFYKKLSNNHIACKFVEKYYPNLGSLDTFTERFVVDDFERFSKEKPKFSVTTKANTLQKLKPLLKKSVIEKTYVFTVLDWQQYQEEVVQDIKEKFGQEPIVVRSSCLNEDSLMASKAGHYHSVLDVSPQAEAQTIDAVTRVISSYHIQEEINPSDQILIQHHTQDIKLSGVIFTKDLATNAPYYVINYDLGSKTDTVTSGQDAHLIKIFKHIHRRTLDMHWQQLLDAIDEIEHIIPELPLDIEFAIKNDGTVVVFQVRPLSANVTKHEICADEIETLLQTQMQKYQDALLAQTLPIKNASLIYSDMAFWNPSELIGCNPSVLAYDLFNLLFMQDGWYHGLAPLQYLPLASTQLMTQFFNKPYINANMAFMSLIPEIIPKAYHEKLYYFYLKKLQANPHLHDKVEFNILYTCYDFDIHSRLAELAPEGFTDVELMQIETVLCAFTKDIVEQSAQHFSNISEKITSLQDVHAQFSHSIQNLKASALKKQALDNALNSCKELGTIPFSTAARMAFIAEALLRSLVACNALTLSELQTIKKSFNSVASQLTSAISDVAKNKMTKQDFMDEFGHLRAGTYDITQMRYDQNDQMQFEANEQDHKEVISEALKLKLEQFLIKSPLKINFTQFYDFVKTATELREHSKFVFTRVISDLLEVLKGFHNEKEFTPEALSYLKFDEIISQALNDHKRHELIQQRKEQLALWNKIPLPALISRQDDFMRVVSFVARPNFVTDLAITAKSVLYHPHIQPQDIIDKIVLIESADPGYHWILSHRIKGLVTKFGGVASHMAICCAEMGVPAAIGCGNVYDELQHASMIKLDCVNQIIERIH